MDQKLSKLEELNGKTQLTPPSHLISLKWKVRSWVQEPLGCVCKFTNQEKKKPMKGAN